MLIISIEFNNSNNFPTSLQKFMVILIILKESYIKDSDRGERENENENVETMMIEKKIRRM